MTTTTVTRHRGVVFSAPLIPALLNLKHNTWPPEAIDASRLAKSETRRLANDFEVGDLLYVKEGLEIIGAEYPSQWKLYYRGDGGVHWVRVPDERVHHFAEKWHVRKFVNPRFMPKFAARIWLRVQETRRERLHEISGRAVLAEGVDNGSANPAMGKRWENLQQIAFADVWNRLHAAEGTRWQDNPEVTVVRFMRIERPEL